MGSQCDRNLLVIKNTLIEQSPLTYNALIEESLRKLLSHNQITLQEVQLKSSYPLNRVQKDLSYIQVIHLTVQIIRFSQSDKDSFESPIMQFSWSQVTLQKVQLYIQVTQQAVQLESNHPSARIKSLCGQLSQCQWFKQSQITLQTISQSYLYPVKI